MRQFTILVLVCCAIFCVESCKNSVEPTQSTAIIEPGRRDYVWFLDTVKSPQNLLNSIDGAAPNDVWVSSSPGDFRLTLFHFDSTRWVSDKVNRSLVPYSVRAFSPVDVWCVGGGGEVWKFDGQLWKLNIKISVAGTNFCDFLDIDGISSSNMFAVGNYSLTGSDFHSLIYHFDGTTWQRVSIAENSFQLVKIAHLAENRFLVLGVQWAQTSSSKDTLKLCEFDGISLREIFSSTYTTNGSANFAEANDGVVILRGRQLSISNGTVETQLTYVSNYPFMYAIAARNEKDIFLGMRDGLAHYNGSDIEYLYQLTDASIEIHGIKTFDKSVFAVYRNLNTSTDFVLRGYLQ